MVNKKEQYEQVTAKKEDIIRRISSLTEDPAVKEYLDLCEERDELTKQQKGLYNDIKTEEYLSCNHIWITTRHKYDDSEGRMYHYRSCIKCGLDTSVCHRVSKYLSFEQRVMYIFMQNHSMNFGINTNISCDLELAKDIYSKIKETYPNIDDETAIKYLENALDNIKNVNVKDEMNESEAKKINFKPKK